MKKEQQTRNKLLGWRLYTLTMGELTELSELFTENTDQLNFGDGRLQELFPCLLTVSDDKKENLIDYAKKLYKKRSFEEKASEEAEIIEILNKKDTIDEKGTILTKDIAEEFNSNRNVKEQWKTRSIGWIIRRLGFDKIHTKNGNGCLIEKERLKYLQEIYGLTNQQDGSIVEKVQQVQKVHAIQIEENLIYPCYVCQKPVPNDLDNCTFLDSKPIHVECYKKLEAQQKNKDPSENLTKEFEASSEENSFRLTQRGDFKP